MDSVLAGDACEKPGRTWESRQAMRGESRREQQFYRYYGPLRQMSDYGPKFCDVRDPKARENHQAISCPDKILTAFCQLGALRMRARRALIFFFDVNHAYIMAEATKTLSLESDATHEPGDELWMGHSVIPRDVACCETTVNLPSFPTSHAAEAELSKSAFIVNDLTAHPDLSTRPYVTGYPNGRFYAGVPITTSTGVNIGAYCILDDAVRDGVSKDELTFLGDMSQTIMAHLETVRALAERQRSNRMVAGLGDFVRGASDAGRQGPPATNMPLHESGGVRGAMPHDVQFRLPDALIDPVASPAANTLQSTGNDYFPSQGQPDTLAADSGSPMSVQSDGPPGSPSENDWQNQYLQRQMRTESWNVRTPIVPSTKATASRFGAREHVGGAKGKDTYQRAAEILCKSLDVDGVAFLDASIREFGGLSSAQNADTTEGSTASSDDSAGIHSHSDSTADESPAHSRKTCPVLGCAQTINRNQVDLEQHAPAKKLTGSFLRNLMRRNPHGKVWTFGEDMKTHSEDAFSSDDSADGGSARRALSPGTQQHKANRRVRRSDGEILQSILPGARCVALHGVWDHTRKRWSVGGLYWTYNPLRYISTESEMFFVAAFCDVIVAETRRLEVLGSDKAKSDFISSVSHELRSPLHGILGSSEMLLEHKLDETATTLVEQIDSCGHTLLEIIDHLLDFANLKGQRLKKGAVKSSRIGRNFLPSTGGVSANNDLKALETSVALDDLTEDSVVSCMYSYYYNQGADRIHTPVILDIDRSAGKSWQCSLATGGWKRVCMNLVTNALKYTPSGFIRISLKQKTRPGLRRKFDAVLTVTDSGKGMSKEFQTNHLFHDFSQEDSLSEGLGLGLHMVSRMVHAMGGKIDITSDQKGTGTRVTVHVPLEHKRSSRDRTNPNDKVSTLPKTFQDLKVGIVTKVRPRAASRDEALSATASAMGAASVEKNLRFLGAQTEQCGWDSHDSCDLKIVMEGGLADCLWTLRGSKTAAEANDSGISGLPPVLVVCDSSPSAQTLRDLWATDDLSSHVSMEHIALPCSIKQLTRAISSALRLHKERTAPTSATPTESRVDLVIREPPTDGIEPQYLRAHDKVETTTSLKEEDTSQHPELDVTAESPHDLDRQEPSLPEASHTPPPASVTLMSSSLQTLSNGVPPKAVPAPNYTMPKLLLVDDNDINLKLLTTFAKKRKYPHVTAADGQLAVDAFEAAHRESSSLVETETNRATSSISGTPTVILMDINMPVMDGYEAAQRIRAYEKKHHLRASTMIAVTALQSEAAHAEAFGSGFDMFLSKPLKLKDLAALVEAR